MTPAKYTADTAYSTTGEESHDIMWQSHDSRGVITKDPLVGEVFHDEPDASREDADEDVEVEEERGPGGRLMLWHTGNDGDVDLGITRERRGREGEEIDYAQTFHTRGSIFPAAESNRMAVLVS